MTPGEPRNTRIGGANLLASSLVASTMQPELRSFEGQDADRYFWLLTYSPSLNNLFSIEIGPVLVLSSSCVFESSARQDYHEECRHTSSLTWKTSLWLLVHWAMPFLTGIGRLIQVHSISFVQKGTKRKSRNQRNMLLCAGWSSWTQRSLEYSAWKKTGPLLVEVLRVMVMDSIEIACSSWKVFNNYQFWPILYSQLVVTCLRVISVHSL